MSTVTVYSLHPNTSEVYKINTFSLNSVLAGENIYEVSTPLAKCIFLQLQLKIGINVNIAMKQLPFRSFLLHT